MPAASRRAGARAVADPAPASSAAAAPPSRLRTALVLVNEGTKFGVSAAAFAVLLYFRNAHAAYALSGACLRQRSSCMRSC
jgi:hypothetical protein